MRLLRGSAIVSSVVAATAAMFIASAQPASASAKSCAPAGFATQVCVDTGLTASGQATAYILSDSMHLFHSPTVILQQCQVGQVNCTTISSRNDIGHLWSYFPASSKPLSAGHIYCARGSWIDSNGTSHVSVSSGCVS